MMGLIVSEVYDALIEAGASPDRAKAAAGSVPPAESMATKEDMAKLETDMARLEANMARLEANMARLEANMATKEDLARLELTTRENFSRLEKQIAVLRFAVFSFGPTILALLVKLTFFP